VYYVSVTSNDVKQGQTPKVTDEVKVKTMRQSQGRGQMYENEIKVICSRTRTAQGQR